MAARLSGLFLSLALRTTKGKRLRAREHAFHSTSLRYPVVSDCGLSYLDAERKQMIASPGDVEGYGLWEAKTIYGAS